MLMNIVDFAVENPMMIDAFLVVGAILVFAAVAVTIKKEI